MKPHLNLTSALLLWSLFAATGRFVVHSFDFDDSSEESYLLAKIDCQIGEKHDYVLVTQSSLFEQLNANLQVKSKVELKCLGNKRWQNRTSGEFKNGHLFQVRIATLDPVVLGSRSVSRQNDHVGQLKMASLFANLQSLENETNRNPASGNPPHNIKLGAVNHFFDDLATKFAKWFAEVFQKFVLYIERLLMKKKTNSVQVGVSLRCDEGTSEKRRQKRQSFTSINFMQYSKDFEQMFKHPFTLIQLEDGSVQDIELSNLDTDPHVIQFKKFVARAFSTQLDERKLTVMEKSELGTHLSHYEMEYDEPEMDKESLKRYISSRYRRAKRFDSHLVSVIRRVNREDLIKANNQYKPGQMGMANMDFQVQQVQLIRDNMLVASGGYFQSSLPFALDSHTNERLQQQRKTRDATNESNEFDRTLKKYLNLDIEYSMVKLKNKRSKRSLTNEEHIDYEAILAKHFANFRSKVINQMRQKRELQPVTNSSNVVCRVIGQKTSENDINFDDKNQERETEDNTPYQECYEYRQIGSSLLNAFYNKTILTTASGKSVPNFESKYKIGARLLGEEMFLGEVDISKNNDSSKLNVNLFGSEYIDLNLCDIRDKVFTQTDHIPLFMENIWFMTNVGVKIRYKLDFQLDLPGAVCQANLTQKITNEAILSRVMSDQLEIKQNTKVELGGVFDASFLIFNGQMRLNGDFDMDSTVDFTDSCLSAASYVKPMNASLGFNYKFFHPVCGRWMEDSWNPKQLSWKLNKSYRNAWLHNACI